MHPDPRRRHRSACVYPHPDPTGLNGPPPRGPTESSEFLATARLRTVDQLKKDLPWLQSRGFSLRTGSGDTSGTPQGHQVSPIMASKVSELDSGDTRDTRLELLHTRPHI